MDIFLKLASLFSKDERRSFFYLLVMVIGLAAFEALGVASVIPFLSVLGDPTLIESNRILRKIFEKTKDFGITNKSDFLIFLGCVSFFSIVFSAIYKSIVQYFLAKNVETFRHLLSIRQLTHILEQPYELMFANHSATIVKTVLSETDQLIALIIYPIINMVTSIFVFIGLATVLLLVNPWLALLAICVLGGLYILVYHIFKNKLSKFGKLLVQSNEARFLVTTELLGGLKDIKMLGKESEYIKRFRKQSGLYAQSVIASSLIKVIPVYLIEAIAFGSIVGVTVILMVISDKPTSEMLGTILPVLGVYAFSAYRMKPAVQGIYKGISSLKYGSEIINSISSLLHANFRTEAFDHNTKKRIVPVQKISFEEVNFKYPNTEHNVLCDIELDIYVGTTVGIVGYTGSGKTSFIDLFLGLLKPTEGKIMVDNILIDDHNRSNWRRSVAYVSQDIFLTNASIKSNIALGVEPSEIDQTKVRECAKISQIDNFIERELPDGYDSLVGERGILLSGGQRQRVGVARALYAGTDIIVFDEATSALDTVTEAALISEIRNFSKKKTIVIVTHKTSTTEFCDKVLVFKDGRVIDHGTYHELKHRNKHFASLILGTKNHDT